MATTAVIRQNCTWLRFRQDVRHGEYGNSSDSSETRKMDARIGAKSREWAGIFPEKMSLWIRVAEGFSGGSIITMMQPAQGRVDATPSFWPSGSADSVVPTRHASQCYGLRRSLIGKPP